jgi:hypothetical protein
LSLLTTYKVCWSGETSTPLVLPPSVMMRSTLPSGSSR